ncbi:MAG: gephyrin-like molybdotransferase Glp [Pseudomonadota bacterium]
MKSFFNVATISSVLALRERFDPVGTETLPLTEAVGRVLAETVAADRNLPGFNRATMDGYAVPAAATFGASEGSPAWLSVVGDIAMGQRPAFSLGAGQAARIATGGMLPPGADAVVMIEHTEAIGEDTVEIYKSVAPGQHMVMADEDFSGGQAVLFPGTLLRAQEIGLLAAFGKDPVRVFRRPEVAIVSTGDEIIPIHQRPETGQIRDVNSYSLAAMVTAGGGTPIPMGITADQADGLIEKCRAAAELSDMVLISGGSSVGTRDYTIDALNALPDNELLVHGIAISPGKPAILARSGKRPVWGLPGHVTSAMIVFEMVVTPFLDRLRGLDETHRRRRSVPARLSRNVASTQGRTDFVRVQLSETDEGLLATPVLGKSGLLNTMVRADGLVTIAENTEGLDAGAPVSVYLF